MTLTQSCNSLRSKRPWKSLPTILPAISPSKNIVKHHFKNEHAEIFVVNKPTLLNYFEFLEPIFVLASLGVICFFYSYQFNQCKPRKNNQCIKTIFFTVFVVDVGLFFLFVCVMRVNRQKNTNIQLKYTRHIVSFLGVLHLRG